MEYNFREIEPRWQQTWQKEGIYKVSNDSPKPKYYVLDMFPYPSGAGLHVGHPLGYIASDIFARYKRLKGFNVLHPMGYDAFGLPAEQYAIEHGVHPAESTKKNIENFRSQLDKIGFCFDWSRAVNTSDPRYYKWTQWIFLQLFKSWFNKAGNKAEPIDTLIEKFKTEGNQNISMPNAGYRLPVTADGKPATGNTFTAEDWASFDEYIQQDILMQYRLCYCGWGEVNWCEALGTVLANDEVVNGVSERGGYPVLKKKLRQWYLRITDYADRLLTGLDTVNFSDAMKEMQSNWIGKSYGAEIDFAIRSDNFTTAEDSQHRKLTVYTTRPDTIFGVDFMVIAPEHELIDIITTNEQRAAVDNYIAYVKSRSERERMAEKNISGVFTGAYAINRFNNAQIPIWISEYVLAGYGTGAIMAVPCGDERDFKFAKHFNIPITNIIGDYFNGEEANATKDASLTNSEFLTGMKMRDAMEVVITDLEGYGTGRRKVNYKMRDAAFSRQRYWGEPFPIIWKDGIACPLDESELPLTLPYVEKYGPGPDGEGPLANVKEWALIPNPSPQIEKGAFETAAGMSDDSGMANVPKYSVYTPMQYELAKQMRKDYTEAEGALWQALRGNQLNIKFRRQHPIDAYIVDFVSLQNRLVVEVDGDYHNNEEQKQYDDNRTQVLNEIGFTVIRFTNNEVIHHLPFVINTIKAQLQKEAVSNAPLSTRGEGLGVRETNTMPGYAGSSWYFLRYMDPHNDNTFCSKQASDYWNQVDVYVGGTEHAVGHLLYSRMWTKALYDLGYISFDEPFKRLVNQGMIQGSSRFVYRINFSDAIKSSFPIPEGTQIFVSKNINDSYCVYAENNDRTLFNLIDQLLPGFKDLEISLDNILYSQIHVDVNIVDGVELDIEAFKKWRNGEYANAEFILEDGNLYSPFSTSGEGLGMRYICGVETEKMSKSKFNTINPDDLVTRYGADTFRMYEMFLGPVEQSKPWDTKGIEGVHRFLKKLWRLFNDDPAQAPFFTRGEGRGDEGELKILHKAIKKIEDDTARFSFNTAVSAFMVCVNELTDARCRKREILEPLLIMLAPYAPHIAEELWHQLGNTSSVLDAAYPVLNETFLIESTKEYPVSINGKLRTTLVLPLHINAEEAEAQVLSHATVKKWTDDKEIRKFIFVQGKMINVVV